MKYSREEAIEKAIKQHREIKRTIKKIMNWDTTLSSIELAKAFKLGRPAIYKFGKKYGLDFARETHKMTSDITLIRKDVISHLQSKGYTHRQIAKALKISHQYIGQLQNL